MTNEVWERVIEFLADLRCSDMQRESLVHLESCNIEKEKLNKLKGEYAKLLFRKNVGKSRVSGV